MNKFLTLSVLSLLMLGNQSSAMEEDKELEQRKNKLKVTIFNMAVQYPEKLLELNDPLLDSLNSNDQANVLSGIICLTKSGTCCSDMIKALVETHGFDLNGGLDSNGLTPIACAADTYMMGGNCLLGKVNSPIVVETLLRLGANPHNEDEAESCHESKSIYKRLHSVSDKNVTCFCKFDTQQDRIFFLKNAGGFRERAKELIKLFDKYSPPKH